MGALVSLLPFLGNLVDRLIPDPQAKAAAQLELAKLAASGELAQLQALQAVDVAQAATNTAEAAAGPFRGGWRPYLGWVCGASLTYAWLVRPLLPWCLRVCGVHDVPDLPALDVSEQLTCVGGMLGLSTHRMFEKKAGRS